MAASTASNFGVVSVDLYTDSSSPSHAARAAQILQSIFEVLGDDCVLNIWDVARVEHAHRLESARVVALPTLDLHLASGRRLRFIGADRLRGYLSVLKFQHAVDRVVIESTARAQRANEMVERVRKIPNADS